MNSENLYTIWVCVDCYFAHANGDYSDTEYNSPFSNYDLSDGSPSIGSFITNGLFPSEHSMDCDFHQTEGDLECSFDGECEVNQFSTNPCNACGTHLAGTRYALAEWEI